MSANSICRVFRLTVLLGAVLMTAVTFCPASQAKPVSASHLIHLGHGIGPVTVGETQATVKKELGKATTVEAHYCFGTDSSGCTTWVYKPTHRDVVFVKGKVLYIESYSAKDQTATHLGVDSTIKKTTHNYPHCHEEDGCHVYNAGGSDRAPRKGEYFTFFNYFDSKTHVKVVFVGRYEPKYDYCYFGCA